MLVMLCYGNFTTNIKLSFIKNIIYLILNETTHQNNDPKEQLFKQFICFQFTCFQTTQITEICLTKQYRTHRTL